VTDARISGEAAASQSIFSLKVCHPAVPEAVPILRHAAADFAAEHGADTDLCGDIALCVSEAVTNAIKHSQAHADEQVRLTAAVAEDWLEVRVTDRGAGFGLRESDGLGLGLPTIARLAAQLTISQEGLGTELRMCFPLPR
jgi:anti-sigma regulatory factor (Ser/Thr protein kinase)